MASLIHELVAQADYAFKDRDAAREFPTRVTGLCKNSNYAAPDSPDHERDQQEIWALAEQQRAGS